MTFENAPKGKPMGTVVLVAATIAAGLIAGLFYAYTCSVMPGLARADAKSFVEGMRGINVAILNGWFMLSFLGAPVLALAAGLLHLRADARPMLPWLIAAFVFLLAMILITGAVHVPMNNALDAGRDSYEQLRARFETPWVRWNLVRTLTAVAGFGCLVGALVTRRS